MDNIVSTDIVHDRISYYDISLWQSSLRWYLQDGVRYWEPDLYMHLHKLVMLDNLY